MVHRTMGLPHKSEPKNSYCVIWVECLLMQGGSRRAKVRKGSAVPTKQKKLKIFNF